MEKSYVTKMKLLFHYDISFAVFFFILSVQYDSDSKQTIKIMPW